MEGRIMEGRIISAYTAFADQLVLEALFSIALGFQPKVRIPKITRRGATFCGFSKENGRH